MSESSPQSLASAIDQQPQADGSSATPVQGQRPVQSAPAIPSLEKLIQNPPASASGDAPLAESMTAAQQQPPQSPPAVPPASQQSSPPATAQSQPTAQEQARLRSLLSQRGFDIPEDFQDDDSIADLIATQLDASAAREQSDEFKAFLKWQEQQKATPAQPSSTQQPPVNPAAELPESSILSAISGGYVRFDADSKKWTAAHPTFTQHADAMNARDAKTQQIKVALATDPDAYIRQQVEARVKEILASQTQTSQAPADELKQVLDQFKQQQIQTQVSQIESWASENASRLYDATGAKTPFYHLYETIYTDLSKADPTFDQRPLERHNEIMRRVTAAEKAFRPQQQAAAQQPPAKPTTFLEGAAARRNGTNRLSEYDGPARNSVTPQIPKGGMGVPSLGGIIHQINTLAEN